MAVAVTMNVYHADLYEAQADPALIALLAQGPDVTPFDRIEWLRLMAEECLSPARCVIAVAREGAAMAALPVCETPAGYGALGNWYSFIARPRFTDAAAAPRLLRGIMAGLAAKGALQFAPLPAHEAQMMQRAARDAGWVTLLSASDRNHVLHASGDFAAWWATRPGPLRETVRRKGRKVTTRIARVYDAWDWGTFTAIYAQSWKPAESSPEFLRRFAQAEGAAGRLRLGIATVDGQPVAAQFWTVEQGTAFIHKLAHLPDAAAHSPGTVLTHAMFEAAFDQDRVTLIDFGTGDDGYKRDWMDDVRPRYRLEAYHPRALRQWPQLAKLLAKRTLRLARPEPRG